MSRVFLAEPEARPVGRRRTPRHNRTIGRRRRAPPDGAPTCVGCEPAAPTRRREPQRPPTHRARRRTPRPPVDCPPETREPRLRCRNSEDLGPVPRGWDGTAVGLAARREHRRLRKARPVCRPGDHRPNAWRSRIGPGRTRRTPSTASSSRTRYRAVRAPRHPRTSRACRRSADAATLGPLAEGASRQFR